MKIAGTEIKNEFFAAITPLLFTFVTVFFTRESIKVFYLLVLLLVVFEWLIVKKISKGSFKQAFPYILIVCGSIGLAAAGILTIEKIALLKDPGHITSCSLSPIVACSPVINSPQASIFTIPNPAFGILGYGLVVSVGMVLLAGATKLKKWWWWTFLLGAKLGMFFIAWLIYQTLYGIDSLCLYCTAAWMVTIVTYVATLKYVSEEKIIKISKFKQTLVEKYPLETIASLYLVVIALILQRFWSYWISLL